MKMYHFRLNIIALLLLLSFADGYSQDSRMTKIKQSLDSLEVVLPALNEKIDISVSGISIQEFLRAVAMNAKINLNVDPNLQTELINNFSGVKIKDMLLFIIEEYSLDIKIIGNIISISKFTYEKPVEQVKLKEISVIVQDSLLTVDLMNDTLKSVIKLITQKTGTNILFTNSISNQMLNGYVEKQSLEGLLNMLSYANDFSVSKTSDTYYLDKKVVEKGDGKGKNPSSSNNQKSGNTSGKIEVTHLENGRIQVLAENASVADIIRAVSDKMLLSTFFMTNIEGSKNVYSQEVETLDNLLDIILKGTNYSYKLQDNIFIIGEKSNPELKTTRVISLQYRTIEKIIDLIPAEVKKQVEVKEFTEQNSLVVTGNPADIDNVEYFLRKVDKVVPVILIEVIIVDVTKKYMVSTGVNAGIGDNSAVKTQGTIFPGVNLTLSTQTINDLINSFNGFGWLNIGKVSTNFYMSLKALEENGVLKLRSTPKLSTLNSHEATLSIGKTEYYLEEQNSVIGTQNPQNITTKTYKSVNADLSITIMPVVSGDDQVTLNVKVKQSDFTARISPNAPPGSVTRNFESLIRVKNEEMVLLGGLEENSVSNSGSGIPLLSRIPVLKWVFSSRTKEKSNSRLNIFIKPTIIY